jgi:hypothetical protein
MPLFTSNVALRRDSMIFNFTMSTIKGKIIVYRMEYIAIRRNNDWGVKVTFPIEYLRIEFESLVEIESIERGRNYLKCDSIKRLELPFAVYSTADVALVDCNIASL